MKRNPVADSGPDTQRTLALCHVGHNAFVLRENLKHNGFPYLLAQIDEMGHGDVDKISADGPENGPAQLKGGRAQGEFSAPGVLLEKALVTENLKDPVDGRGVVLKPSAELSGPHFSIGGGESHQDIQGLLD